MARRRNRKHHQPLNNHRVARKHLPFANPRIATTQRLLSFDYSSWLDDRRLTAPRAVKSYNPIYTVDNAPVTTKETYRHGRFVTLPTYPEKALTLCVRRERRREVLFATGRAAKGSRRRYRRRTANSQISCR